MNEIKRRIYRLEMEVGHSEKKLRKEKKTFLREKLGKNREKEYILAWKA